MKKVINNAVYDTGKAKVLGSFSNGSNYRDFAYFSETLYRTKSGRHFLHGEGGAMSPYATRSGNDSGWGEKIMPMSYENAREWAEKNLDGDEYIEAFGEPEEGENTMTTLSLAPATRTKLDRIRGETGKTLSQIVDELVAAAKI